MTTALQSDKFISNITKEIYEFLGFIKTHSALDHILHCKRFTTNRDVTSWCSIKCYVFQSDTHRALFIIPNGGIFACKPRLSINGLWDSVCDDIQSL